MTDSAHFSFEQTVDQDEPVFQAPWEAHVFALVNQLAAANYCSWSEWTEYLVNEISTIERESPGSKTYYEQWVAACEKLLIEKHLLAPEAIQAKIAELLAAQQEHSPHS
jgi:nitrile hydratase accessory protein